MALVGSLQASKILDFLRPFVEILKHLKEMICATISALTTAIEGRLSGNDKQLRITIIRKTIINKNIGPLIYGVIRINITIYWIMIWRD